MTSVMMEKTVIFVLFRLVISCVLRYYFVPLLWSYIGVFCPLFLVPCSSVGVFQYLRDENNSNYGEDPDDYAAYELHDCDLHGYKFDHIFHFMRCFVASAYS